MIQIRRKAIADVDGCARNASLSQHLTYPEPRLWKELWMPQLFAPISPPPPRQLLQFGGRTSQRARAEDPVSRPRSIAPKRLSRGHCTEQNDVGKNVPARSFGRISARERHRCPFRQAQQTIEETLHPGSVRGCGTGQRQRQKGRNRPRPHRRQVAQATRKRPMPHTFRTVPVPSKMPRFKAEIGGHHDLFPRPGLHNRAVIPDAQA